MEIKEITQFTNYLDIRNNKLVLVSRRVTEGYYNTKEVTELVVGTLIDIIV